MTAAGEVRVMRTLYKDRTDPDAQSLCPLELRTGILKGFWKTHTLRFAAAWRWGLGGPSLEHLDIQRSPVGELRPHELMGSRPGELGRVQSG